MAAGGRADPCCCFPLQELTVECEQWLQEGVLTADLLLGSWQKLLALIRQCNVTLRWMLLHTSQLNSGGLKTCPSLGT